MIERLLAFTVNAQQVGIPNVAADATSLNSIVGAVYIVIGAFCLFFIVRAGLLFVTSGSDPSSVRAARETILYAVIGLIGATLVFGIVQFVTSSIGSP